MTPDFNKYPDGLMPVIIQDSCTNKVLMLGFMNDEAFQKTQTEGFVVFFSRSKQRLWMKGETSGNRLRLAEIFQDCDNDTLLIKVIPEGPVCHTGSDTCFGEKNTVGVEFLEQLEIIIKARREQADEKSYTSSLFKAGIAKISQKVGEEAVEVIIEAMV
jgi:phosphoribosyl-AMP cyclohydrolase / phosphoribosyl-ATP pyrophosphohydrolase